MVSQSAADIRRSFPFSAVAAQDQFKLALLLAAVNPLVGGVLISGPRGSAKSTLANGLADILPRQNDQPHPFVTLPLGASEEMLIGTLNLQQVLDKQQVAFQPGLLAKAHNGVLYVDEVNLLPDNLVDQLLDVVASGVNTVERDGISHQHAARFVLVGTMNPDEGELRPQLTDRFGLSVVLSNQYALQERIDIVRLRERFDHDATAFHQQFEPQQRALAAKIVQARQLLPSLACPDACRRQIAERCCEAQVDGLRADIVWVQSALAHAALAQRAVVSQEDVLAVEELVLRHRRNVAAADTPDNPSPPFTRPPDSHPSGDQPGHQASHQAGNQAGIQDSRPQGDWGAMDAEYQQTQPPVDVMLPGGKLFGTKLVGSTQLATAPPGTRVHDDVGLPARNKRSGRARGWRSVAAPGATVNWFETLAANAGRWPLATLRYQRQRRGEPVVHLILLDTSGSILANRAFAKAKGLILHIAQQAYVKREEFVLLGFGNQQVETLLGLRRAPKNVLPLLHAIRASGGTPLSAALQEAVRLQRQQLAKNAALTFKNYLITDGRVSRLERAPVLRGDVVVIDVEQAPVKRGKAHQLAAALQAHYVPLMV